MRKSSLYLTLSWAGGGTLCPDNFETYIANFFALLTPHIIHWLFIFYCAIYGETLILGKKCILGPQGGVRKTEPPKFSFLKNDKSCSADQILHRIKKSWKQKICILTISFWSVVSDLTPDQYFDLQIQIYDFFHFLSISPYDIHKNCVLQFAACRTANFCSNDLKFSPEHH